MAEFTGHGSLTAFQGVYSLVILFFSSCHKMLLIKSYWEIRVGRWLKIVAIKCTLVSLFSLFFLEDDKKNSWIVTFSSQKRTVSMVLCMWWWVKKINGESTKEKIFFVYLLTRERPIRWPSWFGRDLVVIWAYIVGRWSVHCSYFPALTLMTRVKRKGRIKVEILCSLGFMVIFWVNEQIRWSIC